MLWIFAFLIAFFAWYVLRGRTWLQPKPWMHWLYKSRLGEWVELTFFKKSETILWARFLQAMGYGLTAVSSLGGIDLTPLALVLPDGLDWIVPVLPLVIALAGHIQVQLRLDTSKPIELVAIADKDMTPAVVEAAAVAEATKVEAVAVVKEAEVEKAVAAVADAASAQANKPGDS